MLPKSFFFLFILMACSIDFSFLDDKFFRETLWNKVPNLKTSKRNEGDHDD